MNQKNKISSKETTTRYIFYSRYYAKTIGRIKYPAFVPDKNGETSVFRISNLDDQQIWDIGENHVSPYSSRTLLARGDLAALDIFDEGLEIEADTTNHKLHANIVGWPLELAKIKLHATNLAKKAICHIKP